MSPRIAPPTWDEVFDLAPVSSRAELAEKLGVSPQALWLLRKRQHAHPPVALLTRLAAILRRRGGLLDGRPAPTRAALVRLWRSPA